MSYKNFQPCGDRVLVRRSEAEEVSQGGIIIPDTAKEKPIRGEVLAIGPGALNDKGERMPMDVKVGDVVYFGKWSGTELKIGTEEFLIMKSSDIIGIFK